MRVWSCITSYPLRGLPYLAYDNVNPAMVNSMMLCSSMLAFEKVYWSGFQIVKAENMDHAVCITAKYGCKTVFSFVRAVSFNSSFQDIFKERFETARKGDDFPKEDRDTEFILGSVNILKGEGVLHLWPGFWLFMHFSQKLQHIDNK